MTQEKRILLVEDSATDAELIARTLRSVRFAFTLKRVDTAADLIVELANAPPDMILVDFQLPTLDAFDLLALLHERQLDIPVIVVTGTLSDDAAALCLERGAVDYALKDRLVRLPSAINRALDEKRLRSERLNALTALAESEQRFRQITESIDEVFWLADVTKSEMIYVSPAYEEIWGRPCESAYATPSSWLDSVHREDRDHVRNAALKQAFENYDIEYRIVRPDGGVRWIHDRAFPITDSEGRVYRIAGVAEDITQRRELEQQFRQAQKMEAVGQLAGGIAHDFSNLLTIITGYSQLGLSGLREEDPLRSNLKQIQKAALRAASLTRQLLAFSRRQVLQPRVLDLNQVISNVEGMLGRLIGADIQLETELDPHLDLVKTDPGQIEQVIFNLAINARDAMPQGGILTIETGNVLLDEVYAHKHPSVSPGWYAMIAVSDTGIGMDQETRSHIFEPFFTTKESGKGTGLGLATVYGIIKQSGGSIWVYSEPGRGSTFHIYLPRAEGTAAEPETVPVVSSSHGSETILLAEDDENFRKLVREILDKNSYTVLEAKDADEAIKIAKESNQPIHILLTDVIMPHVMGPELAREVATHQPDIKVIYMSGYTDKAVQRCGVLDASVNFIAKPFAMETLLEKIRHVCRGSVVGPNVNRQQ